MTAIQIHAYMVAIMTWAFDLGALRLRFAGNAADFCVIIAIRLAAELTQGCHENSIGGVRGMRREHASGVTRVNIFTHNGAPQALVGCLVLNGGAAVGG